MHLMFQFILQKLAQSELPDNQGELKKEIYHQNSVQWCKNMIKSPRMQLFYLKFREELEKLVSHEMSQYQVDMYEIPPSTQEEGKLYPGIPNKKMERSVETKVTEGIEHAKYNYQQVMREKKLKQLTHYVGMQKHLRTKSENKKAQEHKDDDEDNIDIEYTIRDGVTKIMKKRKKIVKKLTIFQKQVLESANNIETLVSSVEDNNINLRYEAADIEQELMDLHQEIPPALQNVVPGERLGKLFESWTNEKYYQGDPGLLQFSNELWLTQEEFEKELQQDNLQLNNLRRQDFEHNNLLITNIKEKSEIYIHSLEVALNEFQLRYRTKVDQLNMTISDYESRELNKEMQEKDLYRIIEESKGEISNVKEARERIDDLLRVVTSKGNEIIRLTQLTKAYQTLLEGSQKKLETQESIIQDSCTQRNYYQQILMKLVRDTNILQDDNEKLKKFKIINERIHEHKYQKGVFRSLEHIQFDEVIMNLTNKYYGHKVGIRKIKKQMMRMDIIERDNDYLKSDSDGGGSTLSREYSSSNVKRGASSTKLKPQQSSKNQGDAKLKSKKLQIGKDIKIKENNLSPPSLKVKQSSSYVGDAAQNKPNLVAGSSRGLNQLVSFNRQNQNNYSPFKSVKQKNQLENILESSLEGFLAEPVATNETGQCEVDEIEAQQEMAVLIGEIAPDLYKETTKPQKGIENKKVSGVKVTQAKGLKVQVSKKQAGSKRSVDPGVRKQGSKKQMDPSIRGQKQSDISTNKNKKSSGGQSSKNQRQRDGSRGKIRRQADSTPPSAQEGSLSPGQKSEINRGKTAIAQKIKLSKLTLRTDSQKQMVEKPDGEQEEESLTVTSQSLSSIKSEGKEEELDNTPLLREHKKPKAIQFEDLDKNPGGAEIEEQASQASLAIASEEDGAIDEKQLMQQANNKQDNSRIKNKVSVNDSNKKFQTDPQNPRMPYFEQDKISPTQKNTQEELNVIIDDENSVSEELDSVKSYQSIKKLGDISIQRTSSYISPQFKKSSTKKNQYRVSSKMSGNLTSESVELPIVYNIWKELDKIKKEKFDNKLAAVKRDFERDPDDFRMKAIQIQELQDIIERNINLDIGFDDINELFEANLLMFFNVLNQKLIQLNEWKDIDKFIRDHLQKYNPTEIGCISPSIIFDGDLSAMAEKKRQLNAKYKNSATYQILKKHGSFNIQHQKFATRKQKKEPAVALGDLLMPNFNEDATLLGFQIRADLAIVMYVESGYDLTPIKKAVRMILQLNYILRESNEIEFRVQDVRTMPVVQKQETQSDSNSQAENSHAIQVDESELVPTPHYACIGRLNTILREHMIDILYRMQPNKKGLFTLNMEDKPIEDICNYQLDNVFREESDAKAKDNRGYYLNFNEYLNIMLNKIIKQNIADMTKRSKEVLLMDQLNFKCSTKGSNSASKSPEKTLETRQTPLPVVEPEGPKLTFRQRNQDILDSALEDEFVKTIGVFDDFVDQYNNMDLEEQILPVAEYKQLKEQDEKEKEMFPKGTYIRKTIPKEYNMDDFPELKTKIDLERDNLIDDMTDQPKIDFTKDSIDQYKALKEKQYQTQLNSPRDSPQTEANFGEKQSGFLINQQQMQNANQSYTQRRQNKVNDIDISKSIIFSPKLSLCSPRYSNQQRLNQSMLHGKIQQMFGEGDKLAQKIHKKRMVYSPSKTAKGFSRMREIVNHNVQLVGKKITPLKSRIESCQPASPQQAAASSQTTKPRAKRITIQLESNTTNQSTFEDASFIKFSLLPNKPLGMDKYFWPPKESMNSQFQTIQNSRNSVWSQTQGQSELQTPLQNLSLSQNKKELYTRLNTASAEELVSIKIPADTVTKALKLRSSRMARVSKSINTTLNEEQRRFKQKSRLPDV